MWIIITILFWFVLIVTYKSPYDWIAVSNTIFNIMHKVNSFNLYLFNTLFTMDTVYSLHTGNVSACSWLKGVIDRHIETFDESERKEKSWHEEIQYSK